MDLKPTSLMEVEINEIGRFESNDSVIFRHYEF